MKGTRATKKPSDVLRLNSQALKDNVKERLYENVMGVLPAPTGVVGATPTIGRPAYPHEVQAEVVTLFLMGMTGPQVIDAIKERWKINIGLRTIRRIVAKYRDELSVRAASNENHLYSRVQRLTDYLLDLIETGNIDFKLKDVIDLLNATGQAVSRREKLDVDALKIETALRLADNVGIPREIIDAEWSALESEEGEEGEAPLTPQLTPSDDA